MTVRDEPGPGAAVQLELFSPDRLQVGEGLALLAALEVDRAAALFAELVDSYPYAADARHGLAVARRWRTILEDAGTHHPAAAAALLWREVHVEGEPMTEGLRRAVLEKPLLNFESNEPKLVPPDLCAGTVLLELDRPREAAAALESSVRLVGDDPSWLLVHANAFWRLRLATRSRTLAVRALLLAPGVVTPESLLDPTLQELIQRHGATWAPVFAWLDGVTRLPPDDPGDGRPPSPAVSALRLLQAAEDARRSGGHDAMVAARRRLNQEHPEVFRAYMERLESASR